MTNDNDESVKTKIYMVSETSDVKISRECLCQKANKKNHKYKESYIWLSSLDLLFMLKQVR